MCYGQQTQTEKENYNACGKSNKELNTLIEKKFEKFVKKQEQEKDKEGVTTFPRHATYR